MLNRGRYAPRRHTRDRSEVEDPSIGRCRLIGPPAVSCRARRTERLDVRRVDSLRRATPARIVPLWVGHESVPGFNSFAVSAVLWNRMAVMLMTVGMTASATAREISPFHFRVSDRYEVVDVLVRAVEQLVVCLQRIHPVDLDACRFTHDADAAGASRTSRECPPRGGPGLQRPDASVTFTVTRSAARPSHSTATAAARKEHALLDIDWRRDAGRDPARSPWPAGIVHLPSPVSMFHRPGSPVRMSFTSKTSDPLSVSLMRCGEVHQIDNLRVGQPLLGFPLCIGCPFLKNGPNSCRADRSGPRSTNEAGRRVGASC